ncbi:sensor histidine kinase [Corynebacterium hesseae]|uniref:sensor histidine kinase n=1 Tax=Corynebacterium hesseae TaxID=2913502 RepID=UPI00373F6C79
MFRRKPQTTHEQQQAEKIAQLTASRRAIADAYEVERARIERDLHDGAQQYLVAASMKLGEALLDAPSDLTELLTAAKQDVDRGLNSLRTTVHGIHPQVLQDHGLVAALADVSSSHGPHVSVFAPHPLPELSASVLACGYFFGADSTSPPPQLSITLTSRFTRFSRSSKGGASWFLRRGSGIITGGGKANVAARWPQRT